MLNLGYDASSSLAPRTGVGRFTLELLRALVEVADPERVRFQVLVNSVRREPDEAHGFLEGRANVRLLRRRVAGPLLIHSWARLRAPRFERLLGAEIDVAIAPSGYLPPTKARLLATVHDAAFLRDPDSSLAPLGSGFFKRHWPAMLPHADAIVTDSSFVRGDLLRAYPSLREERLHTIPPGLVAFWFQESERRPRAHFFAVTAEQPRKRVELLLESYARYRTLAGEEALPLRIRGIDASRPLPPGAMALPIVSEAGLRAEYDGAVATVVTSREEGFGYPVLESFARGTPVLCGCNSSLAELGAGAATFVEDESAEGFARAMVAVVRSTPDRDALRAHARRYDWRAAAEAYLRLAMGP